MTGEGMFAGKTVWITGASSGIGEALALAFADRGARLVLSGRRKDALEKVAAACRDAGADALVLPFDTTQYGALDDHVASAEAFGQGVDILVNNAGVSQRSPALETDFDVYRRIVEVDLLAPIALTQKLLPKMVARGAGRLVMISSIAGKFGPPMRSAYAAAKHGLIGYADVVRAETAMHGIKVHVVAPGSVRTDVARNALSGDGTPRGRSDPAIDGGMEPRHVAEDIVRAIEQDRREIILARGQEKLATLLRRFWPDKLFDTADGLVRKGYGDKVAGKS